MVKFIAAPSKKINANNEEQQESNIRKNVTNFSDNKAEIDNKIPYQLINMLKTKSNESNNEIPSQIIDMPKAKSTHVEYGIEENSKTKSVSNTIMMNAKTGKANAIQPRTITHQIITKKANANIMPKPKIALSNKELAINKIQPHIQSIAKTRPHKAAASLPQTG